MNRRHFLRAALATSAGSFLFQDSPILGVAAGSKSPAKSARGFETIGLYCALPTDPPSKDPRMYEFFKACGYNYLEFCEAGFRSRPDLLPDYYKEMSRAINLAHEKGFRVGIVLLAGMEQWKGSDKSGYLGAFSPLDKAKLQERFTYLRQAVSSLRNADIFILLPGDPGGDPEGRSTLEDLLAFCRNVQIVKQQAPEGQFMIDLLGRGRVGRFSSHSQPAFLAAGDQTVTSGSSGARLAWVQLRRVFSAPQLLPLPCPFLLLLSRSQAGTLSNRTGHSDAAEARCHAVAWLALFPGG